MLRFQLHHGVLIGTITALLVMGNFTITSQLRTFLHSLSSTNNILVGNSNSATTTTTTITPRHYQYDHDAMMVDIDERVSVANDDNNNNESTVPQQQQDDDDTVSDIEGKYTSTNTILNSTTHPANMDDEEEDHDDDDDPHHHPLNTTTTTMMIDRPLPYVAWLMSFPNSGTTYTMHVIREYTLTTTATNYGQEQSPDEPSIAIMPDIDPNGPFYRYPTWEKPSKYVLTKTHCGGYCGSCTSYIEWMRMTVESFEVECRTGKRIVLEEEDNNNNNITPITIAARPTIKGVPATYGIDIPQRAVHLIRNPFDNIVARLHLLLRRWGRSSSDAVHRHRVELYNATKDGFLSYCANQDRNDRKQWPSYNKNNNNNVGTIRKDDNTNTTTTISTDPLKDAILYLPCFTEFIRYVKWHNNAVAIQRYKNIPVLTLHYEDYATQWNYTIDRLFDFLSLSPAVGAVPTEFYPGKEYLNYYTDTEMHIARRLIQKFSSQDLWNLLSRYFGTE
jgi:hypothetical protein